MDFRGLFSDKHDISYVVEKATNHAGNAIFITNHKGIFIWVNKAFEELYSICGKDIIGKETPRTINSGLQTQDHYKELWETILSGNRWVGRVVNKTRNDELIDITQTITPIKELGEVTHFIAVHENYKEFKELEEKLYRQTYQLESAQRIAHMGHWCWRVDTNSLRLSNELLHTFNLGADEKNKNVDMPEFLSIIHPDDVDKVIAGFNHTMYHQNIYSLDFRVIISGETKWIQSEAFIEFNSAGIPESLFGIARDITAQREAEDEVSYQLSVFQGLIESMPSPVIYKDLDGLVLGCNSAFEKLAGASKEELQLKKPNAFFSKEVMDKVEEIDRYIIEEQHSHIDELTINNTHYILHSAPSFNTNKEPMGVVRSFIDISERKASEEHIQWLAEHDTLTKLPNRELFNKEISNIVSSNRHNDSSTAILLLDLDHFKEVNDTMGHDVGDKLLIEVAARLNTATRDNDIVCRLGGDEFAVILENVTRYEGASTGASNIIEALKKPYNINGNEIHINSSIGIALYPEDSKDPTELLKQADLAMYKAKSEGRGQFRFFVDKLNHKMLRKKEIETELRDAIKNDELEIYLQPKVTVSNKHFETNDAEALMRWNNKKLGFVSPAEFIPVAESCGLIPELTFWLLRTVIRLLEKIRVTKPDFHIAINISPGHFKTSGFCTAIEDLLNEENASIEHLEFEFTENLLMENTENIIRKLNHLSNLGIQFSIDDFGTGFSSLGYLKRFPVYALKIDKSFVDDIGKDDGNEAVLLAIAALGHVLEMKVVAEGVETKEQLDFLKQEANCDIIQGYYFSKPLPFAEFMEFI